MKNLFCLLMPVMFFFLLSCDKEDPIEVAHLITDISYEESSSVGEDQEISVTVQHPETCWKVSNIEKSVAGKTFNYNIKTTRVGEICGQAITTEVVTVAFDPSSTGEHTLNFLVNGKIFETRKITVTD